MPSASAQSSKRPFWMHQLVEYILGGVLVAQGLQSPQPVLPALAGALVMLNAATVRGPWSAFRVVSRSMHRRLDLVVIVVVVVLALQPWVAVDAGARIVMVGVAGALGFVWWQSSFAEKPARGAASRQPIGADGGRGTEIGRLAGRAIGDGINAAKRLKRPEPPQAP